MNNHIASYTESLNTHRKDMFLVLDVETLGYKKHVAYLNQKVFDLGYKIIDIDGKEYSKGSFIVDEFWEKVIKDNAFYKEKFPYYKEYAKTGYSEVIPYLDIIEHLRHEVEVYDVDFLVAYNLGFDFRVLGNTYSFFSGETLPNNDVFPNLVKWDLYHVACQTILNTPAYIKWASKYHEYGHLNLKTMNVSTGAESCYAFLLDSPDYIEQHTGLSDVEIECQILTMAIQTTKEYDFTINGQSWKIPNERKDKLYLLERQNPSLSPIIHEYRLEQKRKKDEVKKRQAKREKERKAKKQAKVS